MHVMQAIVLQVLAAACSETICIQMCMKLVQDAGMYRSSEISIGSHQALCGEQLLRGWLRAWALDEGLHSFVQREGYGWLTARALGDVATRLGTGLMESR